VSTTILFATLFLFIAMGMPVAISLGLSSLLTILFFADDSLASLSIKLYETSEHYTLLSIPFFILAGAMMSTGGVAKRMVRFAIAAVGHLRGGLAIASVLACTLFAAVSGSSPATVVAIGSIVIAGMVKRRLTCREGKGHHGTLHLATTVADRLSALPGHQRRDLLGPRRQTLSRALQNRRPCVRGEAPHGRKSGGRARDRVVHVACPAHLNLSDGRAVEWTRDGQATRKSVPWSNPGST
jgi:hypothetical protein